MSLAATTSSSSRLFFADGVFCDHGKEGFPQKEGSVTRVVFVVVVVVGLRYNRSLNIFFTLDSGER